MINEELIKELYFIKNWKCDGDSKMHSVICEVIAALEFQRYKPIILQEHDAEPRTMKAIIDTETDEIYVRKLTRKDAEILGMTIEDRNDEEVGDSE